MHSYVRECIDCSYLVLEIFLPDREREFLGERDKREVGGEKGVFPNPVYLRPLYRPLSPSSSSSDQIQSSIAVLLSLSYPIRQKDHQCHYLYLLCLYNISMRVGRNLHRTMDKTLPQIEFLAHIVYIVSRYCAIWEYFIM